jgi:hypothetical protein
MHITNLIEFYCHLRSLLSTANYLVINQIRFSQFYLKTAFCCYSHNSVISKIEDRAGVRTVKEIERRTELGTARARVGTGTEMTWKGKRKERAKKGMGLRGHGKERD